MSPHLNEGVLQRRLDGEMSAAEQDALERHLAGCAACRAELAALEGAFRTVACAVALLDDGGVSLELAHAAWRRRLRGGWARDLRRQIPRAAVFLLGVAGVASATLPGSPVRRWAEALWREQTAAPAVAEPRSVTAAPVAVDSVAEALSAGAGVFPVDDEVRVVVEDPAPTLRIRVRFADQGWADVRGRGAAAGARFRTAEGRVTVADAGPGELEVVLPRGVRRASVTVGGRRYLAKDGEEIRVLAPADSAGPEVIFSVQR